MSSWQSQIPCYTDPWSEAGSEYRVDAHAAHTLLFAQVDLIE